NFSSLQVINKNHKPSRQCFDALVYATQECFYRVIWRKRCKKLAVWEESIGISRAIKRGKRPRVNIENRPKKQQKRRAKVLKEEFAMLNRVKRHRSSEDFLSENEVASTSIRARDRK
ncbi:18156_t:CDS:2, partial [Dentiscutata erythropus]